jgi:hypothetical protein
MAKKLIITEEQYSRLQSQLTESADINNTIKQAKIGDILSFKGVNSILKVKVVNTDPTNGNVMGETEKGDKVTFNVNSYNQTTKMINFKIYNSKKQEVVDTPFQLNALENLGGNVNQTQQQQQQQPNVNGENPETSGEENKYIPGTVYNALINDPELKKLMQHTPWWESFVSELMGKKAEGEGVRNALNFFSSFHSNKLNRELGDGFIVGRTALFSVVSEDITIYYENAQGKTKTFELERGGTYEAVNKKFSFDEKDYKYKVLTNGKVGFTIYVKEKLSEQDVYLCDIAKNYNDINGKIKEARQKDVNIKFLYSDGYKPTQTKQQ